jgi:hypothetical protein
VPRLAVAALPRAVALGAKLVARVLSARTPAITGDGGPCGGIVSGAIAPATDGAADWQGS